MAPIGPLMLEHRLIERMIRVMDRKLEEISKGNEIDLNFIDTAVDFIQTYADRCHHGKEEDILFRDLGKKELSGGHKRIMDELVKEHILGRNNVKKLIEAKKDYAAGDKSALRAIISNMQTLVKFYPKHIEKEDKHFFIPCMGYFTDEEKSAMLKEFWEFNKNLNHPTPQEFTAVKPWSGVHEKYAKITEHYEQQGV